MNFADGWGGQPLVNGFKSSVWENRGLGCAREVLRLGFKLYSKVGDIPAIFDEIYKLFFFELEPVAVDSTPEV